MKLKKIWMTPFILLGLVLALASCQSGAKSEKDMGPYGKEIYLRGTIVGGSHQGWNTFTPENTFSYMGENKYELTMQVEEGMFEFKVADNVWKNPNLGAVNAGDEVMLGVPFTMDHFKASPNAFTEIAESGKYHFVLDATNMKNPILTVTKVE